tara:strand:+ start:293 stop:502 length:210 start_codon:yes stop_codon:yes gene_type:complete
MGGPVKKFFTSPKIQQAIRQPDPEPEPIRMTKTDPRYDKKRKGRRSTILTSSEGADDDVDIKLKTLLGG